MLAAEMAFTEAAVTNDPLCKVFALFEGTAQFLGWHTAEDG